MKKQVAAIFVIFIIALILFNIFSTRVILSDVEQYLGSAKEFAGISTSKVRTMSSWVYPWFLGEFLKIEPSLLLAKLLNASFLVLDAILLYFLTKNKKALLLWVFSPVVWLMASWINPQLVVSFFLLLAYALLKEYEKKDNRLYFYLSGLSLGLVGAVWWAGVYLAGFFILAFFYKKSLIKSIEYVIPVLIGFSARMITDYLYFGFPLYSSIRGFGSNVLFFLNDAAIISTKETPYWILFVFVFLVVSPLVYKLYKLDRSKYKSELIFLGLSTLLFLSNLQHRYFITIAPLVILLLSKVIQDRELWIHAVISSIVIVVLIFPFFTNSYGFYETLNMELLPDDIIMNDLDEIAKDYPNEQFIVGCEGVSEEQAFVLSTLYWGSDIKEFIRYSEYDLSLRNESEFREYSLSTNPKINDLRKMTIKMIYSRTDSKSYDNVKYLIILGENGDAPKGFKFLKGYDYLRLFEREQI